MEAGAGAEAAGAEEVAGAVAEADSEDLAVGRVAEAEPGAVGETNLARRKKGSPDSERSEASPRNDTGKERFLTSRTSFGMTGSCLSNDTLETGKGGTMEGKLGELLSPLRVGGARDLQTGCV